jgi:hypothetical protein
MRWVVQPTSSFFFERMGEMRNALFCLKNLKESDILLRHSE